jgi:glycosyltransferase involved in cell wall biosynthesis
VTGLQTTVELDAGRAVVCFMSEWLRQRATDRSPLALPRRQAIVYGGIDLHLFNGGTTPRPWRWRLMCAGRIEPRKGVHVAIEALALMPGEATLDIVGTPDDEAYIDGLRQRADELGIAGRIRWVGPLGRPELAEHLRETDVFVFPVVWDEPFGMVPLEAMACGAAVIGTGTGGSNEFLHHEANCLRVGKEDPAAIAAAARRLAGDEALRTQLVTAGRETAGRFSDLRYYDELESWLIDTAGRSAS